MILYNQDGRPGADDEAEKLEQSLQAAHCETHKLKWINASDIWNLMNKTFDTIQGNISLMILCIMSHGYKGFVTGADRSETSLENILHKLNQKLLDNIPLVSF